MHRNLINNINTADYRRAIQLRWIADKIRDCAYLWWEREDYRTAGEMLSASSILLEQSSRIFNNM